MGLHQGKNSGSHIRYSSSPALACDTGLQTPTSLLCCRQSITGAGETPAALVPPAVPKIHAGKSHRTKGRYGWCPPQQGRASSSLPEAAPPPAETWQRLVTGGREWDPGVTPGSDVPTHRTAARRGRVSEL